MAEFDLSKIKLIVGLGNAEKEYIYTRHNSGFLFLDFITQSVFISAPKFKCFIAELKINDSRIVLCKPTTMMNSSGEAVQSLKSFYKLKNEEILIIYDDLDLTLGEYKLQFEKNPKVHNGVNSVIKHLEGENFWSLRIGIDGRDDELRRNIAGSDYVLGRFTNSEIEILKSIFRKIVEECFL